MGAAVRRFPLLCALILAAGPGCTSLYRHHVRGDGFSLHGDGELARLESAGRFVERAVAAFRRAFPRHAGRVSAPVVILDEGALDRQQIYLPEARQEGYYLPLLDLVHISPQIVETASEWANGDVGAREEARVVILHELCHHFLISSYPETDSIYWLNEGLACYLETSTVGGDGTLSTPGYHPWLHRRARAALGELGREQLLAEVDRLLDTSWFGFHRRGRKTRNYALAYSVVAHLMAQARGDLEQRIEWILGLSPVELRSRLRELPSSISRTPESVLASLADEGRHRRWALERWTRARDLCATCLIDRLRAELREPSPERQRVAARLLARVIGRPGVRVDARRRTEVAAELGEVLLHVESAARVDILGALRRPSPHSALLPVVVELLEDSVPEVRAAAAAAIARLAPKATITRPAFWTSAPAAARQHEVSEWRDWLAGRGG